MRYTIKAVGDYELDVLGVPFGSPNDRDSDGEYFDAATNLHLDKFPTPPAVYYHGGGQATPQYIGRVVSHEAKSEGVWFRVVLDRAHELARRVWEAAQKGAAYASSGSIIHLVRKAADGHIVEWPLAELSIFDSEGGKQPANKRAIALPALKAVYEAAGISLPYIEPEPEDEADGTPEDADASRGAPETESEKATNPVELAQENHEMTPEEIAALAAKAAKDAIDADRAARQAEQEAEVARKAELEEAAQKAVDAYKEETAEANRLRGGAPYVKQFANLDAYDNVSDEDLAFALGVLSAAKSAGRSRSGPSEDAYKAMGVRLAESTKPEHREAQSAMKARGLSLKANELNQSILASFGDDWVGIEYSRNLWRAVSESSNIIGRIPSVVVPQGAESIYIPVESTPPTFYKVAQASAQASNTLGAVVNTIPTSKMGTDDTTLSVGKLGAASIYTGELEEDSFIPWASELRMALEREAAAVLESLVIDGDTVLTATTNINDVGNAQAQTGTEYYLVMDGFRKLALLGNSAANARSAGALDIFDYLDTAKLLGLKGSYAINKQAVSFIQSADVADWCLRMPEVMTMDVLGPRATIENGNLTSVWGFEVINTPNMHRANQDATYGLATNSAGKIDLDTAANNLYGGILLVRWDQWRLGWKRRIRFEIERFPRADATGIVATMRVGMINRDDDAAAISYGVSAPA